MKEFAVQSASITSEWGSNRHVDQSRLLELTRRPPAEQRTAGYGHTLGEILQQPRTWLETARQMTEQGTALARFLAGIQAVVLTGSGSSEYVGECVRTVLQQALGVAAQTLGGGVLLTEAGVAVVPERPCLMISLARSGNSPESVGALSLMLDTEAEIRHLIITCNREGKLSENYRNDPRVMLVVLDEATNDRSLVMTSSFTNMVLASLSLGMLKEPDRFREMTKKLAVAAEALLHGSVDVLAKVAARDFSRVLYLASGARVGAAREAGLKMLEMTAGRVMPMSETYLGLRHGPMSAIHPNTLIVCFLSSSSPRREYECDLIRELQRKQLGLCKLLVGAGIPSDLIQEGDVAIECSVLAEVGDENAAVIDIVVGQLLAFFRCLEEGLTPDSPSQSGVIHRVVEEFALHGPKNGSKNGPKHGSKR